MESVNSHQFDACSATRIIRQRDFQSYFTKLIIRASQGCVRCSEIVDEEYKSFELTAPDNDSYKNKLHNHRLHGVSLHYGKKEEPNGYSLCQLGKEHSPKYSSSLTTNISMSINYYKKAIKLGHIHAMIKLGHLYLNGPYTNDEGIKIAPNWLKAQKYYLMYLSYTKRGAMMNKIISAKAAIKLANIYSRWNSNCNYQNNTKTKYYLKLATQLIPEEPFWRLSMFYMDSEYHQSFAKAKKYATITQKNPKNYAFVNFHDSHLRLGGSQIFNLHEALVFYSGLGLEITQREKHKLKEIINHIKALNYVESTANR